jgi:hypothetical protein
VEKRINDIGVFILLVLLVGALAGLGIQSYRLQQYMDECRQYREQLTAATDRQSEIAGVVGHTSIILGETVNSVKELREQLKAVEDDYNRLYSLCFDNDSNVYNGEE